MKPINYEEEFLKYLSRSNSNLSNITYDSKASCYEFSNDFSLDVLTDLHSELMKLYKEEYECNVAVENIENQIALNKKRILTLTDNISKFETFLNVRIVEVLKKMTLKKDAFFEELKQQGDTLKYAIKLYKLLNVYIKIQINQTNSHVIICLFTQTFDDTYSITLARTENNLELLSVKPELFEQQLSHLRRRFSETKNVPLLICTLRKVFKLKKNASGVC